MMSQAFVVSCHAILLLQHLAFSRKIRLHINYQHGRIPPIGPNAQNNIRMPSMTSDHGCLCSEGHYINVQ